MTTKVSGTETIKTRLKRIINRDLVPSPSLDPLGDAVYLFFLLRNEVENPLTDQLIDWMNSWVDQVINRSEFGRYVDRDVVSAVFGYCVLLEYHRPRVKVDKLQLKKLLEPFQGTELFFENLTYTLLLGYADKTLGLGLIAQDKIEALITRRVADRSLFNDGKNVAFACILLEKANSPNLDSIVDEAYRFAQTGDVPFDERIYYSWVLWRHRTRLKDEDPKFARKYVDSSLTNLLEMLEAISDNPADPAITLVYGEDSGRRFSKILVGFALDLARAFEEKTIRVSEQELQTAPLISRLGGLALAGLGIFVPSWILLYLSESGYLFHKAPIQNLAGFVLNLGVGAASIVFLATCVSVSASVFWDLTIRGIFSDKILLDNLRNRTRKFVLGIVTVAIIGIIIGIVLGTA